MSLESTERLAALHARLTWAAAALGECDLVLVVGLAERLAERDGHPPVPGRTEPEASRR